MSRFWEQLRDNLPLLIALYLPSVGLLAFIGFVGIETGLAVSKVTRDPVELTGAHPFTGALSNLGILLWAAAASISFFTAASLRHQRSRDEYVMFFRLGGWLTLLLLFDDLFLLHEWIYPIHLGIDQKITFAGYALLLLLYLLRFRGLILRTDFILLMSAFVFFALSLLFDTIIAPGVIYGHNLFEDGFKFLGIVSWFGYFMKTGFVANATWADEVSDGAGT